MQSTAVTSFLSYVRRRQRLMLSGGCGTAAVGVVVIVARHSSANLNIWMGALVLVGALLVLGTIPGRRLLRDIAPALSSSSRTMELQTWGYRTVRAPVVNRVLATLDDVGSTNRVPKFEVNATWFTPGIATAPHGDAIVYGGRVKGEALLAVGAQGAILGRIRKVRQE